MWVQSEIETPLSLMGANPRRKVDSIFRLPTFANPSACATIDRSTAPGSRRTNVLCKAFTSEEMVTPYLGTIGSSSNSTSEGGKHVLASNGRVWTVFGL